MANILLIIDVQKEFQDNNGMYEKIIRFCREQEKEYDIILPTLFCNNYNENSNFIDKLNWDECMDVTIKSLEIYPSRPNAVYEFKYGYASRKILKLADKKEDIIDIVGCDADACIMATAFRLWDEGYNFRLLTDYIYTNADETYGITKDVWLNMMLRNFGSCVISK